MSWLASWPNDEQKKNFSRNLVKLVDLAIDYLEAQLAPPQRLNEPTLAQFEVELEELNHALTDLALLREGYLKDEGPTASDRAYALRHSIQAQTEKGYAILAHLHTVVHAEKQMLSVDAS